LPNPVETGAAMNFAVSLKATQQVRLTDLSIVIHTREEIRVAILDLRACGLPQTLHPGQSWVGHVRLRSLPLVEGEYRVGLYLSAGDFTGNLPDLINLTVEPLRRKRPLPSYAAVNRGMIELNFEVEIRGLVSSTERIEDSP